MNAGIAAYVILTQNTDVTDIVGVNIFPEVAEQETATPFIVYQLLSVAPEDTHDGPSTLDEVRFEFLCYADSYALAADLGSKVRGALDRVSGTYNGVNVESIQFNDVDIDTIDAPRRFAQVLTFTFRIKRDDVEIAQGTPVTGAKLGDLYDVDTTGVTDGQVIAYDAAAQEWQPADGTGGVTELGQLDDVQFEQGGPEDGNVLFYDGDIWTNDTLQKSQIGLGNVDNTSDVDKPVSTATQTELTAKANSADFSNVDNTSDADKPVSTATQTALNAKADTSAVPTDLNDLSDVSIVGTPVGNQALIYDTTAGAFQSRASYTNRFEDEVETGLQIATIYAERGYSVKSEGDGIFIDPSPDTPAAGKVIKRKIYHKTGFITDADVIGDYTLIHTFADDTAYADTVAVFDAFEEGATYGVPPFTLFQTWEEVSSIQYLLDRSFGGGAEAAYSTRQLRFAQTDCMVIRRASDSTTTTIGFDGSGNISEADIETFCTGTSCTVSEWKDQSGNGNDATAAAPSNEPTIYTGGALVKDGGRVAFTSTASTSFDFTQISNVNSVFSVLRPTDFTNSNSSFILGDSTNFDYHSGNSAEWLSATHADPVVRNGDNYLNGLSVNLTTLARSAGQYVLSMIHTDGTAVASRISKDRFLTRSWVGNRQELIIYSDDRTNDRTGIESNMGDYFTQNTPLLDTYSGAAAAYSLRKLRTAYTGDAVEVYNGSSYADIGFNVFGELDTVALAAHCGSNDGFVSKWYDQSSNSNDATQTTTSKMPKIYDGSTGVVTENGKPAVENVLSGVQGLNIPSFTINLSDFTCTLVSKFYSDSAIGRAIFIGEEGGSFDYRYKQFWIARNIFALGTSSVQAALNPVNYTSSTNLQLHTITPTNGYVNGTSAGTFGTTGEDLDLNPTFNYLTSGDIARDRGTHANTTEVIIWTANQSSNRAGIEANQATFYGITI
jgi:hypothetical protein